MPPDSPSSGWVALAWVAMGIVAIGAVWFTRWVIGRLERDRSTLHRHATTLHVHEMKIGTHDEALKELRETRDTKTRRPDGV